MKFTVAALFALVAVATAKKDGFQVVKRQSQSLVTDVSSAAMTDQQGNVIPFNSKNVYQDALAKGL